MNGGTPMAIPNFQEFMLPILQIAGDGNEHSFAETLPHVCNALRISEEDQRITFVGGTRTRIYDRFYWAIIYLQRSELLRKSRRGYFQITAVGRDALAENPLSITKEYLTRFPGFKRFKASTTDGEVKPKETEDGVTNSNAATPEERIEAAHHELT